MISKWLSPVDMVSTTPASFGTYPTLPLSPTLHHRHPQQTSHSYQEYIGIMGSDGRSRRRDMVEEAYNIQVKAGLMASRIPFWIAVPLLRLFVDPFPPSLSLTLCGVLYNPIKPTRTERSAIWCIRTRLGDFRPPYMAHFPVSSFLLNRSARPKCQNSFP